MALPEKKHVLSHKHKKLVTVAKKKRVRVRIKKVPVESRATDITSNEKTQ